MSEMFQTLWSKANKNDAEAQYQLSQHYFQQKSISRGLRWLKQASQQQHAGALETLGFWYSIGRFVDTNYTQAVQLLEQAAKQQRHAAAFRLAELYYLGLGTPINKSLAKDYLLQAAEHNHGPALLTVALGFARTANQQNNSSTNQQASACLKAAAKAGEPLAAWLWARRCLLGHGTEKNIEQAYLWYQVGLNHPVSKGLAQACQLLDEPFAELENVLTNDSQTAIQSQAKQLTYTQQTDHVSCQDFDWPNLPTLTVKTWSENPLIEEYEQALTSEECIYLRWQSAPYLKPSDTIDPSSGKTESHAIRTSYSMFFSPTILSIPVRWLEEQLANLSDLPLQQGETLQVLHYEPGQQYKPHYDYFDPSITGMEVPLKAAGQRLTTCLTYLNTVTDGGETHFPRLDLRIPARQGHMLIYKNCNENGELQDKTLHAGLPVESGVKWVASKWICQRNTPYGQQIQSNH